MSPFGIFTGTKDDGGGGDNWSYKTCKAPVEMSPTTNQDPVSYRPDALHVAQPTVSKHWCYYYPVKGKCSINYWLRLYPKSLSLI